MVGKDILSTAEKFIKQSGLSFDNFLDKKRLLENMLGANRIPLTILVDANGRVLKKVRGSRKWDSLEIKATIYEVFNIELLHDPMFGLHFLNL